MRLFTLIPALLFTTSLHATSLKVETVRDGLVHPWSLAFLPDGQMLVTERSGRLNLVSADGTRIEVLLEHFLDLHVESQAGLFEVMLAPDFEQSRELFLSYACGTRRANNTCLARAHLSTDLILSEPELIFRAYPAKRDSAHYGARIAFLPDDTLILTLGDGFDYREDAQRTSNHLGTIVRLHRDGTVPNDNPLLSDNLSLPEIYSFGHRNVQGVAWHAGHEVLYTTEHGPRGGDELNRIRPGGNYGWPLLTGGIDYTGARITPHQSLPGMVSPIKDWTPSIAPAGLAVYQGQLFQDWHGDLLVPALAKKHLTRIRIDNDRVADEERLLEDLGRRLRDVRVHPDTGAIYLLTDEPNGAILRVTPGNSE
ncbi:MAG: PQQ-dependent sugar dehydrogenase [Idiomarina sp.]|nr:PQQ-dependent sugar dehydrogenase [Idiomarina sp.]